MTQSRFPGPCYSGATRHQWAGRPRFSDASLIVGTSHDPGEQASSFWRDLMRLQRIGCYSVTNLTALGLINDAERSDMNFIRGTPRSISPALAALNIDGIPLIKPPWGRITAIDLNEGEILWQVPHGDTPDHIRNHPLLDGVDIPKTGRVGRVGTVITKTLVIAGEAGMATTETGERGAMLRAYDKSTGAEVGAVYMPAPASGAPMTYMHDGRQYVALAISGGGFPERSSLFVFQSRAAPPPGERGTVAVPARQPGSSEPVPLT